MTTPDYSLTEAYQYCQQLANAHYENFPVASVLLPKRLRLPVCVIYAFARRADDIADEGQLTDNERLQQLTEHQRQLDLIASKRYHGNDPILLALADVIHQYNLPIQLLSDLLTAFRQDVTVKRYETFADVLAYCRYSANPVGRLILHLAGRPNQQQLDQSDAICTALQLINFYQDVLQDYHELNRVYLPLDKLKAHGLAIEDIQAENAALFAPVLRDLFQLTQEILRHGVTLGNRLTGRIGWEVRAMTLGGVNLLNKLQQQADADLFNRPRLSRFEQIQILACSASKRTLSPTMPALRDSRSG